MQTQRRSLVVSVHDVSPLTRQKVAPILRDLFEAGVDRMSLLVIPNHHKLALLSAHPDFCDWLRQAARPHEVVMHGYSHLRPQNAGGWWNTVVTEHYTAGEGEFYDLGETEALSRLAKAKGEFAAAGLTARGFIAPAWLLGAEAELAVKRAGFEYTTRLRSFKDLVAAKETVSQSLVWSVRAGWRRLLSLCWNPWLAGRLSKASLLRIGIHPPDWDHRAIRRQALRLVRDALAARESLTYEDWLTRLRSQR